MKDGLNKRCRDCFNEGHKKLRLADRLEVLRHYSGGDPHCACCGEKEWEFLSIDHIGGGGKEHIKSIGYNLHRWLKRNGYPDGFRVLCHNCNFAIGHYGYCPHQKPSDLKAIAEAHSRVRGGKRKGAGAKPAMMIADVCECLGDKS